jgi:SAM-dependent methyltransferase
MDQVVEHIKDPISMFKDIRTLLKPSGKIIFSTPCAWGWGKKIWGRKWVHWHIPYHVTFFSERSLEIFAQQTGFEVEEIRRKTSSEWVYYQWKHLLFFPQKDQPSYFWAQHRGRVQTTLWRKLMNRLLDIWHKLKLDHLITRFFDAIKLGDNMIVIMSPNTDDAA